MIQPWSRVIIPGCGIESTGCVIPDDQPGYLVLWATRTPSGYRLHTTRHQDGELLAVADPYTPDTEPRPKGRPRIRVPVRNPYQTAGDRVLRHISIANTTASRIRQ